MKLRKVFYIAIAVAAAISIYLFISSRDLARSYVLDLAQKSYPGIKIGEIGLSPFGLEAGNVSWSNPDKPEIGFRVSKLRLNFSLSGLAASLHNRNPLRLISSIDIDRPVVRAGRSAAGAWILPLPAKRPKEQGQKLVCRFDIRKGRVELKDEHLLLVRHKGPPSPKGYGAAGTKAQRHKGSGSVRKLVLSDVRMSGRVRGELVDFRLDAASNKASDIALSGWTSVVKPLFAARLELSGADPLFWHPYIVSKGLSAERGKFDLKIDISGTPQQKGTYLDYGGTVSLHGVDVALPGSGQKFSNVDGAVSFGKDGMSLQRVKLRYRGLPLQVRGTIRDYHNPVLDLAVTARGAALSDIADLKRFTGGTGVAGKADIAMRLSGKWSAPSLEGIAGVSGLSLGGRKIGDIRGQCQYSGGMLRLPLIKWGKCPVSFTGLIDLRHGAPRSLILAECRALSPDKLYGLCSGLDVRHLPASGSVSGSAVLQLQGLHLTNAGFLLQGKDISFRGVTWRRAAVSAKLGDEGLLIRSLSAEADRGTAVKLYGAVDNAGRMRLQLDAVGLPGHCLGNLPVEPAGKLALSGSVTGTLKRPGFSGMIGGEAFSYKGMGFKNFSGGIIYDGAGGRLMLKDMFLHPADGSQGRVRLSGEITADKLDLEGRIQGIDVALLSSRLGNGAAGGLKGLVSGTLNIGGQPDHPSVKAFLQAEEFLLAGRTVKGLRLDAAWDGSCCSLENVSFTLFDGHLSGSGRIEKGRYVFDLKGRDLSMVAMHNVLKPLPSWNGKLDLDGHMSGKLDDSTTASGNLQLKSSGEMLSGGVNLGSLTSAVKVDHGKADYALSLLQGEGKLELDGTYAFKNAGGGLKLRMTRLPVKTAVALYPSMADRLALSDARISGTLTAENIDYARKLAGAEFNLQVDGGSIAGRRLDSAVAEGAISGRRVELRLEVSGPSLGRLSAAGWSDISGKPEECGLHLDVKASASDLPALTGMKPDKYSGKVSMVGSIDGKWSAPVLSGSFTSSGGSMAGYRFDSLEGSFATEGDTFNLKDVYVKRSGHKAVINGSVPVDRRTGRISGSGGLDLDARLSGGDLSLISIFMPGVREASGNVEAALHITGKPGAVEVYGRAVAAGGKAEVDGLGHIDDLQTVLSFRGSSVDIEAMVFRMGRGLVSGGGRIGLPGNTERGSVLYLKSSGADVRLPWFRGRVDGELQFSDDRDGADMDGKIRISEGDVYLQRSGPARVLKFPMDPRLKLSVHVNEGVRISSGNTRAAFSGDLLVGGSISDPRIIGELVSHQGDINISVISSPFRLVEARAVFSDQVSRQPLLPGLKNTIVNLQARAVSRIGKTEVYMDVAGRLPDIKISFSSRPEMNEDEIIALLGRKNSLEAVIDGRMEDVIKDELIRLIGYSIRNQLFQPLGRSLADALGMGEVSFDYDDEDVLSMRLGRYIFDRLYVSYTTRIFALEQRNIMELDYYLKNNISLSWMADDASEGRGEVRWQYRF